jgi:hypothetical protein
MAILTERMKNWVTKLGGHIATSTKDGVPTVVVVESALTEKDSIFRFKLSDKQLATIKDNLAENPKVAVGPGGIGSIRAAYQFKGDAHLEGSELVVEVTEIYCTKPGPEAGVRLDVLSKESIIKFEESRWKDIGPQHLE